MKRAGLGLIAAWLAIVFTASMHTYGDISSTNAGVWWHIPATAHWCGYEYKGHPGFFCDLT